MDAPILATVNACLNGASAALLTAGWALARSGRKRAHRACMLGAVGTSTVFLATYLTFHAMRQAAGTAFTPFQARGAWRFLYFYVVLWPHSVLAVVMLPFIALALRRALRGEFERHRRVARPALLIWWYVSVTGVLVYLMLYVYPGAGSA